MVQQHLNVLVTGVTGALDRHLVTQLRRSGHRARILTRATKRHVDAVEGDPATGAGLYKGVTEMDAIIHADSATIRPTKRAPRTWSARAACSRSRAKERVKHVV